MTGIEGTDARELSSQKEEVSERDRAYYNALDPHAVVTNKPWEFEARSRFLRLLSIPAIVVIMAVHIWMGATVGLEYTGAAVTPIDEWAFPGVGVVLSVLAFLALNRPHIKANADGVEVRNIIGTRFYSWQVIYGLSFPEGSRMALLELPDFEYVPVWALQSGDGMRTADAVSRFRELEAAYMPVD